MTTKATRKAKRSPGGKAPEERWRAWWSAQCCERAKRVEKGDPHYRYCVCAWLENCETHGLYHVGTHD